MWSFAVRSSMRSSLIAIAAIDYAEEKGFQKICHVMHAAIGGRLHSSPAVVDA